MIAGRDSRGRFIKGNVLAKKRLASSQSEMTRLTVRKVIDGGRIKLKLVPVGPKKLIGGGVLKLERVQVICPACGEQVEAVASDGRVKGYCAVAKQSVDFPIETQGVRTDNDNTAKDRSKQSAASKKVWQDPEYRAKQTATHTGKHHTIETRTKISAAAKKRWQDPEYRSKLNITHKGKHLTAETKAKISAVHMGKHRQHAAEPRIKIPSVLMGKHLAAETKAKISAAKKGKHPTAETRAKISAALIRRHSAERGTSERPG